MAQSSEHSAEDLIPIQNFMRRFSHVDLSDQEPSRESLVEAAAAAAAKEPSLWEKFTKLFERAPAPPPPREPTRHDWSLLPLLNAKNWLVGHPKTTSAIFILLLSTVADRTPYYDKFHKLVCWCIEDDACVVGFILRRANFMILCI